MHDVMGLESAASFQPLWLVSLLRVKRIWSHVTQAQISLCSDVHSRNLYY